MWFYVQHLYMILWMIGVLFLCSGRRWAFWTAYWIVIVSIVIRYIPFHFGWNYVDGDWVGVVGDPWVWTPEASIFQLVLFAELVAFGALPLRRYRWIAYVAVVWLPIISVAHLGCHAYIRYGEKASMENLDQWINSTAGYIAFLVPSWMLFWIRARAWVPTPRANKSE